MTSTSKALTAGVAALCKSAILVIGVPLALVRMWLLARGRAGPFDQAAWQGRDAWGHAVLALVAAIWLVAAGRLLRDLVRALRGRLASPSASWSARWATRVAGLMLLASAGSAVGAGVASAAVAPHRAYAAGRPTTTAVQLVPPGGREGTDTGDAAQPADLQAAAAQPATAAATAAATATAQPTATSGIYVVRPGDCLESIAQRVLGSSGDWPVLARINMGRLQPDGRRMTDASLIYPGWTLRLPRQEHEADTAAVPAAATHAADPAARTTPEIPVRADTSTAPAASLDPPPGSDSVNRPSNTHAAGVAPTDTVVRPEEDPGPVTTTTTSTSTSTAVVRPGTQSPARQLEELAVLGLGLLTTAALARRLRLLRRLGECLRRPGERFPAPHGASGAVVAAIDPLAETQLVDWVEYANRLLWRSCSASHPQDMLPEVRLVRAGPDGVELFLVDPITDAPSGFVALDGGRRWALDASLGLDEIAALTEGCGRYVPELVPVGDAEDASYLVALGPGRRLALDDRGGGVAAELAGILVGLRTLPWAAELQVELVGTEGLAPLPAERCHRLNESSPAELADIARATPPERRRRLSETWTSELLVVAGEHRPSGLDEELLSAVGRVAGLISVGGAASSRLLVSRDSLLLEPDGIVLRRDVPSARQVALVSDVLAEAAADPARGDRSLTAAAVVAAGDDARGSASPDRGSVPGAVEVRILGPTPEVAGFRSPPSSKDHGRVVELLAYLVLHGHGATTERIRDAVFSRGDRVASLGRVHNVCSAARSALGSDAGGRAWLPASVGGRYRLDASATCDWLRFESMRALAATAEPATAADLLAEALSLVHGVPLADVASGWDWMLAEGTVTAIVSSVVDGAHHLATLAIAAGDADRARWAVAKGRSVEPWSEILARDAMVVADLLGDRDALRRAWHELESGLDRLDGNEPSTETRALYEELVEPRRPLAGAGPTPTRRSR